MKKIVAIALVALMLISLVACNADSTSDLTNIGDYAAPSYTYTTDKGVFTYKEAAGDTAIITGYTSTTTEPHRVIVPNAVGETNDRIVVGIGAEAFKQSSAYVSAVTLPTTVVTIDNGAFHSCKALTEIAIPDSVTSIGNLAFYGCSSLTAVKIGNTALLESIGDYAFSDCTSLESFTFSASVQSIGTGAFKGSAIKKVELPETVKTIGDQAFVDCANLNTEGCIVLTKGITSIGKYAFSTDVANIVIPEDCYAYEYFYGVVEDTTETTEETTEETTTEDTTTEEASEEVTTEETTTEETTEATTDAPAEA